VKLCGYGVAKQILDHDVDVNRRDSRDAPLLIYPLIRDNPGTEKTAELLLLKNAEVNAFFQSGNTSGLTPLMVAAYYGSPSVELLLKRGANINGQDSKGRTPLMYATVRGNSETAKVLLNWKANTDLKTKTGLTVQEFSEAPNFDEEFVKTTQEPNLDSTSN